mmetsp:Transcript_5039/g.16501  ORF Transcript_5039/g.16501 Transcript_5039/m.16501 type:complete len:232 (-) Transcript_5039:434-1129(-)
MQFDRLLSSRRRRHARGFVHAESLEDANVRRVGPRRARGEGLLLREAPRRRLRRQGNEVRLPRGRGRRRRGCAEAPDQTHRRPRRRHGHHRHAPPLQGRLQSRREPRRRQNRRRGRLALREWRLFLGSKSSCHGPRAVPRRECLQDRKSHRPRPHLQDGDRLKYGLPGLRRTPRNVRLRIVHVPRRGRLRIAGAPSSAAEFVRRGREDALWSDAGEADQLAGALGGVRRGL